MGHKVLIIEDTKDIAELMILYISEIEDVEVLHERDGANAIKRIQKEQFDVIVLDLGLPRVSGYDVLKKIRENHMTPVIIVSAKSEDNDKILGLNLGADDYLAKPFNPLELVARVRAQLRRFSNVNKENGELGVIRIKNLKLDRKACELFKDGKKIELTYTEFKLIRFFMEHPNQVYTKKQLYAAVWDDIDDIYYDNTIMVYISKLREKIEGKESEREYIVTIRGLGYKFVS